jgi:hypothetical protein
MAIGWVDSIRGIKLSSVAGINTKPTGVTFNPGAEQKRVPSFDDDGYKTPGYPMLMAKDYSASVTWGSFSAEVANLATEFDTEYSINITFATTGTGPDNPGTFHLYAAGCVIDGQGLTFDPLGDSASIGFVITDTSSVSFAEGASPV